MNLTRLKALLPNHTNGYLTTIRNGKPELREWQLQFIEDDKIYFVTSCYKEVYKDILHNPNISFACATEQYFFRISGEAVFIADSQIKQKVLGRLNEQFVNLYTDIKNNGFTVFYITNITIKYSDGFMPFESFK